MKTLAALLLASVALVACQKSPEQSTHKGQGGFNVETLFTHEGCTVYRFYDDRTVYYTNCVGQAQSQHSCGKNCTTTDIVTTTVSK